MVTDRIPEMKGVFQMSLVSQEPIKEGLLEIWVGGQREKNDVGGGGLCGEFEVRLCRKPIEILPKGQK